MKKLIFLMSFAMLLSCNHSPNSNSTIHDQQNQPTSHDSILSFKGRIICQDTISHLVITLVDMAGTLPNLPLGEQIFAEKSDTFNLQINKKLIQEYPYLHFKKGEFYNILKISEIKDNTIEVPIDKITGTVLKKPAIYLYPNQITEVHITHDFKGKILNTYPAYENGWSVTAYPDGKLVNHSDKRTYNYLFWDGTYSFPSEHYRFDSGFIVERNKTVTFLQEKLAILGLNNTEINDFIVFWLPELSQNQYNFIHFSINDDIDHTSYLYVKPQPDTTIRVFMEFKGLENKSDYPALPEQILPQFTRKGFTMVEWGGAAIEMSNSSMIN